MIVTPGMLREVAKDIEMVAGSVLGRVNIRDLLVQSAAIIERLEKVNANMTKALADSVNATAAVSPIGSLVQSETLKKVIGGYGDQPQVLPKDEPEAPAPTEKELAREMVPMPKGKKARK